ncbi:MAG: TonB-dependent receptor [Opitutaceae bacterium]
MNTLGLHLVWKRVACTLALSAALATPLVVTAQSTADARKSYDLPADNADKALRRFSEQAGIQVLFPSEVVRDVRTGAVKGNLTVSEALDQMLAGTGLVAVQDSRTGALTVRREGTAEKNGASPVATGTIASGPTVIMDEYAVTGSRLRLNSGEQPAQPVLTFTSADIERTGAADLGQLFQYIPSLTSYSTGIGIETLNGSVIGGLIGQTTARTSATLRGGSETSTLLLVDGKRVPITARRNAGGNGYDLGGIPLSAIDRVEVLLDGASAIYGADAIHGVINVILKKHYSGTELKFNYDNTFDGDAGIRTVSLTHGFSSGKLSGLLTLSGSDNNVMLLTDRRLLATYDRRTLGGTSDGAATTTAFFNGAGSVNVATGSLPGITPATPRASIPTDSNGQNLTAASFAGAPVPVGGNVPDIQSANTYTTRKSLYGRLTYEVAPWLRLAATARAGTDRVSDNGRYRIMENVTIPSGYPGNPFSVPVRLQKIFQDLPAVFSITETKQGEFGLTATGKLPADWRYEASINYLRGENNMIPTVAADGSILNFTVTASTVTAKIAAANAAGRRPALIYDSRTQSPNAAGALDEFWVNPAPTVLRDLNEVWTYSGQVDGKLFSLPGGEMHAILGTELREEYVSFPSALGGAVWGAIPQRDITSVFAETKVPLFSAKQGIPLLHQLELGLAARVEDYSDVGGATTPRYSLAWRPAKAVLVRASFGEGFLVPQLYRTAQISSFTTIAWSALASSGADPARGNTVNPGSVTVTGGGNPGLEPQKSEHTTYGFVIDVPKIKGLSVSADWFDNKYTDGFGSIGTITDRVLYAPQTITRGPNLPTDQAGWAGPITAYDGRTVNIAGARAVGYNVGLRYHRTTDWGSWSFTSSGEKFLRDEQRVVPSAPLTATINKRYRPMRVTTSLFWSREAWDVGLTHLYGGEYWADTTNATIAPSRFTDDTMRWDVAVGYDFANRSGTGGGEGASWWRRALHNTKWRATIINVFDKEPPLDVRGFFSASVIDPRLRRYVLDLTVRF